MKQLTCLLLVLTLNLTLSAKEKTTKHLTTEQKLSDFNSLYTQLKDAYPFFDVNKRQNNIDWLNNHKPYKERIKQTQNDKEFLAQIEKIIKDLNNGHASIYPTKRYQYYLSAYRLANYSTGRLRYTLPNSKKTEPIKK